MRSLNAEKMSRVLTALELEVNMDSTSRDMRTAILGEYTVVLQNEFIDTTRGAVVTSAEEI